MHLAKRILVLLLLGCSSLNYANISYDILWSSYTFNGRYNDILYTVEPQIRFIDLSGVYQQFLLNEGLGFGGIQHWQFWLGQTITNNNSQNNIAEDFITGVTGEYRLWQQVNYFRNKTLVGDLLFRTRFEERNAENYSTWSVRGRERIFWTIPLIQEYAIILSDEALINLKRTSWITAGIFDQNRVFVGLQKQLSSSLSVNISYLNQYINTPIPEINHGLFLNVTYTSLNFFD